MKNNWIKIMVGIVAFVVIVSVLTGNYQWGILAGAVLVVTSAKWFRLKKKDEKEELEYDERINENIKKLSFQTLSISNVLLLAFLLFTYEFMQKPLFQIDYLLVYLCASLFITFYIVPFIARKI
ncbi:hypothetical protein LC085_21065 [Bacillus tianshenii]|uniref:hypothetical protein n=1 Tax=Sutcliffiella tianshenii TaxID=1463404 RepID=UPI001CD6E387|nr:hypothetical protein [Bacillus tianshenii]MCA1322373.1 hypothetical protein [Bacillus tianshenii]